jgi:hypothetical protein
MLERREEIVRRWLAGESQDAIAADLGVNQRRIWAIIHIDAARNAKRDHERSKIVVGAGKPKRYTACGELGHNRRRHAQ